MEDQKQHIIPKVYLKQFGYVNKNGTWKVPVFKIEDISLMNKIDKTIVRQSNIESLLREQNIYDIPLLNGEKRILENFFKLTEDNYQEIINEIKNQSILSFEKKDRLLAFIALLYVRAKDFRQILGKALSDRDNTFLLGIMSDNIERVNLLYNIPKKSAINILSVFSGGYVYNALRNSRVFFINTISSEKWATTDNPVMVKFKIGVKRNVDFFGVDTKLLCPLSKDYLAYIDYKESKMRVYPEFDSLMENKVSNISENTFEIIWKELTDKIRITEFLILPTEKNE